MSTRNVELEEVEWRLESYGDLTVYEIDLGALTGLYVNVIPVECLDYNTIEEVGIDRLLLGHYDIGLTPSATLLAEISAFHDDMWNRIQTRNHQMISSAVSHGKPMINAKLKCQRCRKRSDRINFIENKLTMRASAIDLRLF